MSICVLASFLFCTFCNEILKGWQCCEVEQWNININCGKNIFWNLILVLLENNTQLSWPCWNKDKT